MKIIRQLFKLPLTVYDHWNKWGSNGLLILIKRMFLKNQVISIKLKNFKYPIYLRNNTSDITVFYQIFYEKSYAISEINLNSIIDCGANIGLSSLFFSMRYPNAKIIALEPENSNFQLLLRNTKSVGNIHALRGAVWCENTFLQILNTNSEKWSFELGPINNIATSKIKTYSIDKICEDFDLEIIDLIKIDIEGSEKELFEKNYDLWLPATKIISIELHDHIRKGASQTFFNALNSYNYQMVKHKENLIFYFE